MLISARFLEYFYKSERVWLMHTVKFKEFKKILKFQENQLWWFRYFTHKNPFNRNVTGPTTHLGKIKLLKRTERESKRETFFF